MQIAFDDYEKYLLIHYIRLGERVCGLPSDCVHVPHRRSSHVPAPVLESLYIDWGGKTLTSVSSFSLVPTTVKVITSNAEQVRLSASDIMRQLLVEIKGGS